MIYKNIFLFCILLIFNGSTFHLSPDKKGIENKEDSIPKEYLKVIPLFQKTPDSPYLFAYPHGPESIDDLDNAMKSVKEMGFNTIFFMANYYRSEDGSGVSWKEDLPFDDPQYHNYQTTDKDRKKIDEEFIHFIKSAQKHDLKIVFNVGTWMPQTWFRKHPDAISRLPDGEPLYDINFQNRGVSVYLPCFRSNEFRLHSKRVIQAWLKKYENDPVFQEVICRVSTDSNNIYLDPNGMPVFFIHQDTYDREWCCCERCQKDFQAYLQSKYQTINDLNLKLDTNFTGFGNIALPAYPPRRNFDSPGTLWFDAVQFWSEGILEWKNGILCEVKEFYPDANISPITKYPFAPLLTDFKYISQGSRIFYSDPYPMEHGFNWNLLRYLYQVEVYQSAAKQNGQILLSHLQGFENLLPKSPTRAPTVAEFKQQHFGLFARGVTSNLTFTFNLMVDLLDDNGKLINEGKTKIIVKDWHETLKKIDEKLHNTTEYTKTVILRYNPQSLCSMTKAQELFKEYEQWKSRGVPVRVVWDDNSAQPDIPDSFEFRLTGDATDWDMFIRKDKDKKRYLIFVTNLSDKSRKGNLSVDLEGEDMRNWEVSRNWPGVPVESKVTKQELNLKWNANPEGICIMEIKSQEK